MSLETERSARPLPRLDHAPWLTVGIVLLLALVSAITAILLIGRVGDGCVLDTRQVRGQSFHTCVGHWSTPLRSGDELLAVAGHPLDSSSLRVVRLPPPPGWHEGGAVHYTVRRDGQTLDLMVPLHRLSPVGVLRGVVVVMSQSLFSWLTLQFLTVLVIFILAPRNRAAQLLLLAVGGLTVLTTFVGQNATPTVTVSKHYLPIWLFVLSLLSGGGWYLLFVPTILFLVLSFPRRVWLLARFPRLVPLLIYSLPLVALIATLITGNGLFALAALGLGALTVVLTFIFVTIHTWLRVHDRVVRAQTAWIGLGLAVGLVSIVLLFVAALLVPGLLPALEQLPPPVAAIPPLVQALALPLCLGIAITRYRLFEIEVLIRRTLIYGALTVLLTLLYLGGVIVLQRLFHTLTGQTTQFAVVASTLMIAALFNPLRHRIQDFIDRRFYRGKYDAQKTLTAFSASLRSSNNADLEHLTRELVEVIEETVKPASLSIWLREEPSDVEAAGWSRP